MISSSLPVIVNTHCAEFPAESVKVYVTGVEPTGKLAPGWWVVDSDSTPPELSIAVGGIQVATADVVPHGIERNCVSGQPLIMGAIVSIALTVKIVINDH